MDKAMDRMGMVELDGSYLEGGGQILRTACSLSAVTDRPCRVFNIRKARMTPGLRTQHLAGLQTLAAFTGGRLRGGYIGSTEIFFYPGGKIAGEMHIEISTAGSITLALQLLLLPALMSPGGVRLYFRGGATDTHFSPTVDYFTAVLLPNIKRLGFKARLDIRRRGYYPKGGAEATALALPSKPVPSDMAHRGKLLVVKVYSGASSSLDDRKVAQRQAYAAREALGDIGLPVEESVTYYDSLCPGSSICLVAEYEHAVLGSDGLGKSGVRAERVGAEAAHALAKDMSSGACMDRHMADQILPFVALAGGTSKLTASEITAHSKANMWVIEQFIEGGFDVEGKKITWRTGNLIAGNSDY